MSVLLFNCAHASWIQIVLFLCLFQTTQQNVIARKIDLSMSMSFIGVFKPHQEAFNGELRSILLYLYKS